jgi:large subunit ribosomal protein L6
MSRIGKQPVVVPDKVKVKITDGVVYVEGPLGKLEQPYHRNIKVVYDEPKKVITVTRPDDDRFNRALHGLTRRLISNMVDGVTKGFEKRLIVVGVGYQARIDKGAIVLTVGLANQIRLVPPAGITVTTPVDPKEAKPVDGMPATIVLVKGADKQAVGQFAADIRSTRKPEPYAGKGVRYEGETIRRKEGKSFASGG